MIVESFPCMVDYLPVKEEFNEGMCQDLISGEIFYYNGDYGDERPEHIRKVKLFLFTRESEINLGDVVWTNKGIGKCIVKRKSVRFPKRAQIIVEFGAGLNDTTAYFPDEDVILKVYGKISKGTDGIEVGQVFWSDAIKEISRSRTQFETITAVIKEFTINGKQDDYKN